MRRIYGTHHCAGLGENAGDGVKDLYHGFEIVDQFSISVTVCLKLVGFVCKEVEDAFGRVTALERLGEGMGGKVYASLFGVFGQSDIKNRLKVRRGGGCCGRHRNETVG